MNPIKQCSMYYYLTCDGVPVTMRRLNNSMGLISSAEKANEGTEVGGLTW